MINKISDPVFMIRSLVLLAIIIGGTFWFSTQAKSEAQLQDPDIQRKKIIGESQIGKSSDASNANTASNEQIIKEKEHEMKLAKQRQIELAKRNAQPVIPRETILKQRREKVKEAFRHSFLGYANFAFGHDEVHPVSNKTNDSWGGFGISLVDGLDTMIIMDLAAEMKATKEHIWSINWDKNYDASFFETTIRYLGGLLSAYTLDQDKMYLEKAVDLADRLLPAFDTPTGIPYHQINLQTGKGKNPSWTQGHSILSELGSVQLEFKYLSYLVQDPKYAEAATKVMMTLSKLKTPIKGLFPTYIHPRDGSFGNSLISFGGLGDSFYEYLLKQHLLTNQTEPLYRKMYDDAMQSMIDNLVFHSGDVMDPEPPLWYIAEMHGKNPLHKMDHLVCYVPGMLALGARKDQPQYAKHIALARELLRTCYQTYTDMPTGLGPETVEFQPSTKDNKVPMDKRYSIAKSSYLLRPETVESMFVLYRITGDSVYQEWGWNVFEALMKNCKTPTAFSGIKDVSKHPDKGFMEHNNSMQSFFWAETLKYLYLLFSPTDLLPLDQYVFTTEAHPLKVLDVGI